MELKAKNLNKVSAKKWAKWSERQRRHFNAMFFVLKPQNVFAFPARLSNEEWDVLRWNVAFQAACVVEEG